MIDRTHRFHGYGSLHYVYQNGQSQRSAHLTLKYSLNPKRSVYRLAVVVSKKVNKSAVVRNRIRRRIYEFVRIREPHISEAYDIVVSVFDDQLADMPQPELETMLSELFDRSSIFANSVSNRGHGIVNKKEL